MNVKRAGVLADMWFGPRGNIVVLIVGAKLSQRELIRGVKKRRLKNEMSNH